MTYADAVLKRYTNQPFRFWYFDGLFDIWFNFNGRPLRLARVSEVLPGLNTLNYRNKPKTILDNYFTLLISGSSHYTELEAYLTPAQYEAMDGALTAKFNGDIYYIAEISGYDPTGRNASKLKLIRKI